MSGCGCGIELKDREERGVLIALLAINGVMFVAEMAAGWYADSTALIADALDMLADAAVYAIALYAVGRSLAHKRRAARLSGWFQILLGLGVLADVARRALTGSEPEPLWMAAVGAVALAANLVCLRLIHRHRHGGAHMRASWIFSCNDVIANAGVILGALLVATLGSPWPDLLIGAAIAALVVSGGVRILRDDGR